MAELESRLDFAADIDGAGECAQTYEALALDAFIEHVNATDEKLGSFHFGRFSGFSHALAIALGHRLVSDEYTISLRKWLQQMALETIGKASTDE